ncbi:uncharacterized protein LOC124335814 isoform X2 [Daphnia pulicaria]|uniref:uncharacterized protein LOC124335814 isoform X1 n=1 Tax=Daphnia pulicaria TaxID=35523 RepID=UPI001EE9EF00|nr:uncharacterized protein LOC124335814 isoform X1 [Daphnia pulicaria]XP_046645243.1 uncharacterized protein LOC124335814 isoform X2 [Daphnia pulicaria]
MQNIDKFVNILEEFVFNLNEIHTSSDKALPDFDVKITPLIYTFAKLVVEQSRLGDCQKEYEAKLVKFLDSLPIHPTLHITPCHSTAAFLTSLLSDEISEEPAIQTPEDSNDEKLVTNVNPPITETTDVCLSVKHQVENPANFPTPSRTPPLI